MTITTTDTRKSTAGNGSTTAFPTGFVFFKEATLVVTLVVTATGAETPQVELAVGPA